MPSAAEQLSVMARDLPEETAQEMLNHLAALREKRRAAFVAQVREAQEQYRQGNYQTLTVDELMEALNDD